jgi:hypothetical protein
MANFKSSLQWVDQLPLHQRRAIVRLWREYGTGFDPTGQDEEYDAIDIGDESIVIRRHPRERFEKPLSNADRQKDLKAFLGSHFDE